MLNNFMKVLLFAVLLFAYNIPARADGEVIEHNGDHYVIHVDSLHPDSEMTLMDVLHACPELTFVNGGAITEKYILYVDNIAQYLDPETFLLYTKASEVSQVMVYNFGCVSQGSNGETGVIDISFKEPGTHATSGKVAFEGSTYGNGKLYADITTRQNDVTVRGYALTNLQYAKITEGALSTSRRATENAHVHLDWDISPDDNLKIKFYQQYNDFKERYQEEEDFDYEHPEINRYVNLVASYSHILNDNEASITAEAGSDYLSKRIGNNYIREFFPYFYAELGLPCLNNDLNIIAGWEIDYDNYLNIDYNRQQVMSNDFYVQLDFERGPWVITLGDRYRHINNWSRSHAPDEDNTLSTHVENTNCYMASAGFKAARHFIQGSFSRDFYIPGIDDYYEEVMNTYSYLITSWKSTMWNSELRYTYQTKHLACTGSVYHSLQETTDLPDSKKTGVRASLTWHKGPLRITAGGDFYRSHFSATEDFSSTSDNYLSLKLAPTLLLGKGFRLSSVLIYRSRQYFLGEKPHFYASVKLNKDLSRHCNVYADFHDLAGQPRTPIFLGDDPNHNRALTLGMNFYF